MAIISGLMETVNGRFINFLLGSLVQVSSPSLKRLICRHSVSDASVGIKYTGPTVVNVFDTRGNRLIDTLQIVRPTKRVVVIVTEEHIPLHVESHDNLSS
jgi:uncharacterized membrane protein